MLNPTQFDPWFLYGRYCGTRNRFDKAETLYRKAQEMEPDNYNPVINLAMCYGALGRQQEETDLGWRDGAWMVTDSDLESRRTMTRFKALLARMH